MDVLQRTVLGIKIDTDYLIIITRQFSETDNIQISLFEQPAESSGNLCVKLHALSCHGVSEAQHVGVQTKSVDRVIAIAVFYVAAYRVSHVGGVYSYLVLSSCLKPVFYERVLGGAVEDMEVCHRIFSAIVCG